MTAMLPAANVPPRRFGMMRELREELDRGGSEQERQKHRITEEDAGRVKVMEAIERITERSMELLSQIKSKAWMVPKPEHDELQGLLKAWRDWAKN